MKKVTMLVDTYYGRALKVGDTIDVSDDVAQRWEENRIARIDEQPGDKPIERMSVAELNEQAALLGLTVDSSMKKADIIEMINAAKSGQ